LRVRSEIIAGPGGIPGALVLADGRRIALGDTTAVIGRMPECTVALSDAQVSRRHAEIRREDAGFCVVDLNSMNGTQVNGVAIREHVLADGDVITIGATSIRYEES
jgi:pSer/pThr/pTyr-binding forkhead associated (FHA) protein